jgi:trehalose 6-phosphate synthase/phosphatase
VSVQVHPIGIDVSAMERLAALAGPPDDDPERVRHVLGVDRLDYTKGIHGRLLAVERLLEKHPEYHGRVVFTQLLVPSRERVPDYRQLKQEIDEAVGRINGRFSEKGWAPVRYMVRSLPPEELVTYYRRADIALVTPLRDGMNLVAKEYASTRLEDDGVLILSELAGAAEELQEALLVNPFDIDAVAEALDTALSMPDDERRARMSALRDRVRANDVHQWVRRFLAGAESASERARATAQSPLPVVQRSLSAWLAQRPAVALFLDYDGTLTPIAERPDGAVLSDTAREALVSAGRAANLDVVIVSGRSLADLKTRVGVAGLTYVGNHGFEIEGPGLAAAAPDIDPFRDDLEGAALDLEQLRIEGGWVERKGATLSYHLRQVPGERRPGAVRRARVVLRRHHLATLVGNEVVEARPPIEWHKGAAVLHVLRLRHGADWISRVRALYLGDDATDEEAFRSLKGIGRSVCVAPPGPAATLADYSLPDPTQVVQLVRWLASGGFRAAR